MKKKALASLGIWKRFIALFRPDFLSKLSAENSLGKSWSFWFLSNILLTILTAVIGWAAWQHVLWPEIKTEAAEFVTETQVQTPDGKIQTFSKVFDNFTVTFTDGKLSTQGLPEPFIFSLGEDPSGPIILKSSAENISDETVVILIDTKGEKFTSAIIDEFSAGVFIFSDRLITKKNAFDIREVRFSEFMNYGTIANNATEPMKLSELWDTFSAEILPTVTVFVGIFAFIVLLLFMTVFRLVSALWWGLVFWLIGKIFVKSDDWNFSLSFQGAQHFLLPVFILDTILSLNGIGFFGQVTVLIGLFYGMNFYAMTRKDSN